MEGELNPTLAAPGPAERSRIDHKLRAFYQLGKPNLSLLVVVTALIGMFLASTTRDGWTSVGWTRALMLVLGTALTAMGACAANMYREADTDARMRRTCRRPLPSGRLKPWEVLGYASITFTLGFLVLWIACGPLVAMLSFLTLVIYALVYTPAKRLGPVSVWIGAVPGAIPPVMGAATVTGRIDGTALSLFLLMFTWQLPHFFALAYMYREDYARGGFRFLPSTDTERKAGRDILMSTGAVLLASLVPSVLGLTGAIYLVIALIAGASFLRAAFEAARKLEARTARRVFLVSIGYLPSLLVAIVLDRLFLN